MKNFQEDLKHLYEKSWKVLLKDTEMKKEEARSRAIQYPSYLIRYTIGGFVITFHLLIFVFFILRLIWLYHYAFKWVLEFIFPILILPVLQSLISRWSTRLIITHNQRSESTPNTRVHHSQFRNNLENALQYFMLVASKIFLLTDDINGRNIHIILSILDCFIGIASSILRLITGLLFNIVFINRIDFPLFQEPLKKLGKTYIRCGFFLMHFNLVRNDEVEFINLKEIY